MIIESSQLSYQSASRSSSATVVLDKPLGVSAASTQRSLTDTVQLSSAGSGAVSNTGNSSVPEAPALDAKQQLALLLLERLLGRKLSWQPLTINTGAAPAAAAITPARLHTELHAETEQTAFHAEGQVTTADGRDIRFDVQLTMERAYASASTTLQPAKTKDPLVVNLNGGAARLTTATVRFDLDNDGTSEQIAFVAQGSALLGLDRNANGRIDNGGELFGPATGDGFAELASYDLNGNGWIDSGDAVFADLRLWSQSGVETLAQAGIGAIATSSAATPFSLKDAANNTQGVIRSTGVFLMEDGGAGTVQHVDLVAS